MDEPIKIRTPPHSLEAEMAALGSVMIKPSALDDLADLSVDDFFLPVHREIVDVMRALTERRQPVEFVTVAEELKVRGLLNRLDKGEMYLIKLANATPTAENARHYAGIITEKARLRRLIALNADLMSRAYADAPAETLLALAREGIGNIEVMAPGGPVRVGDEVDGTIKRIEERGQAPDRFLVPTGLAKVDRKVGGLRANHLIVVAANPGRGKTAWAWNVAIRAALSQLIPVLVFSLEMDLDELIERALAHQGRINGKSVSLGRMSTQEWYRLSHAASALAETADGRKIPLYVDDRKLTAAQICAEARRWRTQMKSPRALIVIDYLGLVEPDQEERTREREVAKMSRMFKKLAHKTQANAPVILVAQLNRDNMKGKDGKPRPPQLSDLRDSGAIEADADAVIFPWWDSPPPATGRHPSKLLFGKYRGGHTGEIEVDWEPEFMTFSDTIDEDEEAQTRLDTEERTRW